jgi:hypothetical protein
MFFLNYSNFLLSILYNKQKKAAIKSNQINLKSSFLIKSKIRDQILGQSRISNLYQVEGYLRHLRLTHIAHRKCFEKQQTWLKNKIEINLYKILNLNYGYEKKIFIRLYTCMLTSFILIFEIIQESGLKRSFLHSKFSGWENNCI